MQNPSGGYILNFFADTVEDIQQISNGKKFVTKNGTDYGVPLASSTVIITAPDKSKLTYVLNEKGEWKEYKEDSYPRTVVNYNLAPRMATEWGLLLILKEYLENTKGMFSYDDYANYIKRSIFGAEKRDSGYYTATQRDIEPERTDMLFGKLKDNY